MAARCQWARIVKVRELWRQLRTFFLTGWAYKQCELVILAIRTQTKGAPITRSTSASIARRRSIS